MALRAVIDHPKFTELKRVLGQPKGATLGWLESIWHFTGRYTQQGNIGKYTDQAIEAWVEWNGKPGALIAALIATRWIDVNSEHRLLVHDWHQHADNATKTALRRAHLGFFGVPVSTLSPHCGDTFDDSSNVCRPPEPVPEPEPVPGPEPVPVPGPELNTCAAASATPDTAPAPETGALDEKGDPLALPLVNGVDWPVPASMCVELADAFPAVNVLTEFHKIRVWLKANPKNRKTAAGVRRFIVSWMGRSQNSARPAGGGGNGYVNRGQARTNSNLDAARAAAARMAARATGGTGGVARGGSEQ